MCVCSFWGFQYLQTLHLQSCDLLDVFGGISFFPLDKMTYLKIQSFVNRVEESLSLIKYTAFLYNDQLIWYRLETSFVNCVFFLQLLILILNLEALLNTPPQEITLSPTKLNLFMHLAELFTNQNWLVVPATSTQQCLAMLFCKQTEVARKHLHTKQS